MVVAGGGPTGVEISGMLAEMQMIVFRKDYPEFYQVPLKSLIYLVDGSSKLLSPMSQKVKRYYLLHFGKVGHKIILNTQVTDYIENQVILSNGQTI